MLKRTLMALAMVGMAATPASADLLVPDQVINANHVPGAGTIGIYGASVNGNPVASPGFLGGGVASQASIPANVSDTIVLTFAFHWPFDATTYYPLPYLGVQLQNRLIYDNSEVQVLGATGAGGWTPVNFGIGANNSKMVANGPSTTTTSLGATNMIPGTSTMVGANGTPLKGFPNPSSGNISTAPGFGRFAVDPPITFTAPFTTPTANGATKTSAILLPFSSTFPFMKVSLHVKSVIQDGLVDLFIPSVSAFMLIRVLTTTTSTQMNPFTGGTVTNTNTHALAPLYFTGSAIGDPAFGGSHGVDVIPEPASATLMGIGLFCLVGGGWRRRRRFGKV